MKVKFYTNAGMEIIASGIRILCDPWFIPGAFDGSWWHCPPLSTKPEDLSEFTHLYISHIHPDHCDVNTLKLLKNKNVPVIILKGKEGFLKNRINACGFSKFLELEDGEYHEIAPGVKVTMYGAFTPNVFIESAEIPNIIDSSIVVSDGKTIIFNANDNNPTKASCERILSAHKNITIALLPYGGVGPYPSSYDHLTQEEKKIASCEKKKKYLNHFLRNVQTLKPAITVPCAGQMILGGRQFYKNEFLGVPSLLDVKSLLENNKFTSVILEEGDILDSHTLEVTKTLPSPKLTEETLKIIANSSYWWEELFVIPEKEKIDPDLCIMLNTARARMKSYQEKYKFFKDWVVGITLLELQEFTYEFSLTNGNSNIVKKIKTKELFESNKKFLQVKIPYSYLLAILKKQCHWNNAYHGCLVEWYRRPDEYLPEIQTLLSYFHL